MARWFEKVYPGRVDDAPTREEIRKLWRAVERLRNVPSGKDFTDLDSGHTNTQGRVTVLEGADNTTMDALHLRELEGAGDNILTVKAPLMVANQNLVLPGGHGNPRTALVTTVSGNATEWTTFDDPIRFDFGFQATAGPLLFGGAAGNLYNHWLYEGNGAQIAARFYYGAIGGITDQAQITVFRSRAGVGTFLFQTPIFNPWGPVAIPPIFSNFNAGPYSLQNLDYVTILTSVLNSPHTISWIGGKMSFTHNF